MTVVIKMRIFVGLVLYGLSILGIYSFYLSMLNHCSIEPKWMAYFVPAINLVLPAWLALILIRFKGHIVLDFYLACFIASYTFGLVVRRGLHPWDVDGCNFAQGFGWDWEILFNPILIACNLISLFFALVLASVLWLTKRNSNPKT